MAPHLFLIRQGVGDSIIPNRATKPLIERTITRRRTPGSSSSIIASDGTLLIPDRFLIPTAAFTASSNFGTPVAKLVAQRVTEARRGLSRTR